MSIRAIIESAIAQVESGHSIPVLLDTERPSRLKKCGVLPALRAGARVSVAILGDGVLARLAMRSYLDDMDLRFVLHKRETRPFRPVWCDQLFTVEDRRRALTLAKDLKSSQIE